MNNFEYWILAICFVQILTGFIYKLFFRETKENKKRIFEEYARENNIACLREGQMFERADGIYMVDKVHPGGWTYVFVRNKTNKTDNSTGYVL